MNRFPETKKKIAEFFFSFKPILSGNLKTLSGNMINLVGKPILKYFRVNYKNDKICVVKVVKNII